MTTRLKVVVRIVPEDAFTAVPVGQYTHSNREKKLMVLVKDPEHHTVGQVIDEVNEQYFQVYRR